MSDGWKFSLEDLEEDEDGDEPDALEPGSPTLEHILFVALGALAALLVLARLLVVV